jgi:DNA helicase-2/ATP-dependent DNA helicase PcrA
MPGIDFAKVLNKEQLAAATAPDGPSLVLAAAGTGKTRTLVYRVAYLVEKGIDPARILLLTFTNRAAKEMLERARTAAGDGVAGIWGGTFHHMANRILRQHARAIGYEPGFVILDRDDSLTLIASCVRECKLQDKEFPKRDVLMSLFSAAANKETDVRSLAEKRFGQFATEIEGVLRVHEMYQDRKRKLGTMDFDDLLINCLKLFREKAETLSHYQDKFLHVLVDEYQDTNSLQAEIVDKMAAGNRNILVVGDDFQSIYSWRGANYMNIMSFPERYPDARVYKLETNYRSVPEILDVANACIAGNPEQFQKTLRPTREAYKKPAVVRLRDGAEQARYVVEHIRTLCRSGYKLSDIAVLYRAHFHAMELQIEMTHQRVAHVITSGMRFFEQAHIKDVCSVLRLLENPGDEMAFVRLMGLLPGVGEKTAEKIWKKNGARFDANDALQRKALLEAVKPSARSGLEKIMPVFAAYKDEGLQEDAGEVIHRFTKAFYEQYAMDAFEDPDRRLDDIMELVLYTSKYESTEKFLIDVALVTNLDAEISAADGLDKAAVRLTTVHQAKGLEYPAVIILWATDGMFPSSRSMNESPYGEAEERRLFYVAVTRAKDELCICMPEVRRNKDGSVLYCAPSRFVEELPPGVVQEVRPGFI